jgi:hypothetical protein
MLKLISCWWWRRQLRALDENVRLHAACKLAHLGDAESASTLMRLLCSGIDGPAREAIDRALQRIEPQWRISDTLRLHMPMLLVALEMPERRPMAEDTFAWLKSSEAIPLLLGANTSRDASFQAAVSTTLVRLIKVCEDFDQLCVALRHAFEHKDYALWSAAQSNLHSRADQYVVALANCLHASTDTRSTAMLREVAVKALAALDETTLAESNRALRARVLATAVDDADKFVKQATVPAVVTTGSAASSPEERKQRTRYWINALSEAFQRFADEKDELGIGMLAGLKSARTDLTRLGIALDEFIGAFYNHFHRQSMWSNALTVADNWQLGGFWRQR